MSGPKVDMAVLKQQNQQILAQARNQRLALAEKIRSGIACMQNTPAYLAQAEILLRKVSFGNEMTNLSEISRDYEILLHKFESDKNLKTLQEAAVEKIRLETSGIASAEQKIFHFHTIQQPAPTPEFHPEQEIQAFLASQEMTALHRKAVQELLSEMRSSPEHKENYYQEYQKLSALIRMQIHKMHLLYQQYQNECFDMPQEEIKKFSDFETPESITQETERIRQQAEKSLAKNYIQRQIDEVMTKYGYNLMKSELLRPLTDSGQNLYQVSPDTALNVFVSDENQVTMRVIGIGFDTELTPEQNDMLFEEQCAFCRMHPQIVKELELRGVLLQEKKYLPADKKYNKKIQTEIRSDTAGRSGRNRSVPEQQKNIMYRS